MSKLKIGIISTAAIGVHKVVPALANEKDCEVTAIASRDVAKAEKAAKELNLPKAYGSYEELIADPEIDVIYNPLPNHLHVPVTLDAMKAEKHVLVEKPMCIYADEMLPLLEAVELNPQLKIMEGFMYKHHLQWKKVMELVADGALGKLKHIQSYFSYYMLDADNIRNIKEVGGGALLDIGCYSVSLSRHVLGREPEKVFGRSQIDPVFEVDKFFTGILDFDDVVSTFTCCNSTQTHQWVEISGDKGTVRLNLPFNPVGGEAQELQLIRDYKVETIKIDPCDQFTLMFRDYISSIKQDAEVGPYTTMKDGYNNMKILDALRTSDAENRSVSLELESISR